MPNEIQSEWYTTSTSDGVTTKVKVELSQTTSRPNTDHTHDAWETIVQRALENPNIRPKIKAKIEKTAKNFDVSGLI